MTISSLTAAALAIASPAAAGAAAPKLLTPTAGATVAIRAPATFKVRDGSRAARRRGIYIVVSQTRKRKRNGDLKRTHLSFTALGHRTGDVFAYTAPALTVRSWFLSRPGTYYWQAYRLGCGVERCHVHSKIRRFRVR